MRGTNFDGMTLGFLDAARVPSPMDWETEGSAG